MAEAHSFAPLLVVVMLAFLAELSQPEVKGLEKSIKTTFVIKRSPLHLACRR
jgi:hypothetical protein